MPRRRIPSAVLISSVAVLAIYACASSGSPLAAQMILAETPLDNVSDSFYENFNIGFRFSIPGSDNVVGLGPDGQPTPNGGINFSFNVPNSVIPPFGGFDPNSDARFGIGFLGGNGGFLGLNLTAGQGSDRTYTNTTPYVVLPNGGTGSVSDTTQRPFVTSFIPVVGDDADGPPQRRPGPPASRSRRAGKSSATTGDLSVAEIKRRQRDEKEAEIEALLAKARQAAADGKRAIAKIHYRNAARRASDDRRREILDELEKLMQDD